MVSLCGLRFFRPSIVKMYLHGSTVCHMAFWKATVIFFILSMCLCEYRFSPSKEGTNRNTVHSLEWLFIHALLYLLNGSQSVCRPLGIEMYHSGITNDYMAFWKAIGLLQRNRQGNALPCLLLPYSVFMPYALIMRVGVVCVFF